MKFRPAAVPLITVDPFFSIWSCNDALYSSPTEHWSGRPCPIVAGVFVDNLFYSVSGFDIDGKLIRRRIYQRSVDITPTSTTYKFENQFMKLELTFTTPLLLNRIDILLRPVSYIAYKIEKKIDKPMRFIFGIGTRACVDKKNQAVEIKKTDFSISCGNVCQSPLAQSGDNVMIDWGYLHLCDKNGKLGRILDVDRIELLPINATYNGYDDGAFLFTIRNESEGVVTVAYDEIKPIEYFGDQLDEYYKKHFDSFGDMVKAAVREYSEIKALCDDFDALLMEECGKLGDNYEKITSLAYRQAIAAHKLIEDNDGNLLFLSKENDSNGCIATLDVTYPSIPLFLKYDPELVKGMLRPILKFARSDAWKFDFTPHDVGQYPLCNGQVYGRQLLLLTGGGNGGNKFYGEYKLDGQMPVEEAGNMLLCLAAIKKYSGGDKTLFDENKDLMKQWVNYLVEFGYDPTNQLCTDDFAGHLARNCNLSLKAILGIAAYAELSGDSSYMEIARQYAKQWEIDAKATREGTRLTFDDPDSWSLKYNIVWDDLLGYNIFSEEVKNNEIKVYKSKMNRYGVPLDSRADYTKIDWLMWSTCISNDKDYFDEVCQAIVNMINETLDRVPLTDFYYTSTADYHAFRNRSVVGGLFINLLKQTQIGDCKKWTEF